MSITSLSCNLPCPLDVTPPAFLSTVARCKQCLSVTPAVFFFLFHYFWRQYFLSSYRLLLLWCDSFKLNASIHARRTLAQLFRLFGDKNIKQIAFLCSLFLENSQIYENPQHTNKWKWSFSWSVRLPYNESTLKTEKLRKCQELFK